MDRMGARACWKVWFGLKQSLDTSLSADGYNVWSIRKSQSITLCTIWLLFWQWLSSTSKMSLYCQVCNTSNSRLSALNTGNKGNVVHILASEYSKLASGSMTPTPSCGVCHHQDSDDLGINLKDDNIIIARPAETILITPATKKCLKASCEDTAHAFNINPNRLTMFVEVCPNSDYIKLFINV